VQKPIRRRSDDHLAELAVGRRSEDQHLGIQLFGGFQQTARGRAVRDLVIADLQAVRQRADALLCFLSRVRRQLLGVLGVFGVDTCDRGSHPRPWHDRGDRERRFQRRRRFDGQVQRRSPALACEVSNDDGHFAPRVRGVTANPSAG
jgi:hypothetical protein